MRYFDCKTKCCYIEKQLKFLSEENRNFLVEISDEYWNGILNKVNKDNYILEVENNIPVAIEIPNISDETNS